MAEAPLLSVILPVYNEGTVVGPFCEQLSRVLRDCTSEYEVLIVDDGSTDGTVKVLRTLSEVDPHLRFLSFSRNFGHQAALKAGLDHAGGKVVVTMDGDGQHPPELIPRMLGLWQEGFDIVSTRRTSNVGERLAKKVLSRAVYPALRRLTGLAIEPGQADFRLLDRRVVDVLATVREHALFFRGLIPWLGFRATVLDYEAAPRLGGRSKFTLRKQWELAVNGVFSFTAFPLRVMHAVGLLSGLVAVAYSIYVVVVYLFSGKAAPGWASLAIGLMLILAYLSLCFGALGEYVGRMYIETLARPLYIVREASLSLRASSDLAMERRALMLKEKGPSRDA